MAYEIRKEIIIDLPQYSYRNGVGNWEGVVDHSTATPEATDEAESRYFHREWRNRQAFPHFCVDWDSITQLADTNYQAWAAGNGNPRYVHIELCETKDPAKFQESYKRYIWLTAYVLKQRNLGVKDGVTLVSHDWVSKNLGGTNHSDPIGYLASHGINWSQHVANVSAEYNGTLQQVPQQTPQPVKSGIGVGSIVTVKRSAQAFATGESIADHVKGSKYKVIQVKSWDKSNSHTAYLLEGIMSWVLEQDIEESGVNNGANPQVPVEQPKSSTRRIVLPASDPTWTVYKLGHPCIKSNPANIAGVLKPAKFGGLTYSILKNNGNGIYEIQTANFGRVQIYAAPSTGAKII